jgi:hypothetical protein
MKERLREGMALVGKRGKRRVGLRRKADRRKAGKIE